MTSPHSSDKIKGPINNLKGQLNAPEKAFVISDVHLKKMATPNGAAILHLIQKAQSDVQMFIILGDLFDLWLGQGDYFKREYAPLIEEIKILTKTCRVIFFEGNHDLHLKKFWEKELGVEVYTSPQMIEFGGMKIWAEHGDEINREDRDYLFLRWVLRSRPIELLIYSLPSKISAFIGNRASKASRAYTAQIVNNSKQTVRDYAQKLRLTHDFDLCLVGHTHVMDDFKFETEKSGKISSSGRLINLGSWYESPCYLEINASAKSAEVQKL